MSFDFWRVDADALQLVRADGTGRGFTRFVNNLLETEAQYSRLPMSEVHLNLQINLHDGGADAAVSGVVTEDSSGWMRCPTVWQFKRSRLTDVKLRSEIRKKSVKAYIKQGYAYRLCICQEQDPREVKRQEGVLAKAQRSINPAAPPPRMLTASSLASWVSRFPALVLTYFRAGTVRKFINLDTWRQSITAVTRDFVPIPEWKTTSGDIQRYGDFSQDPPVVPFLLKGEAGVGKTRLCFESLAATSGNAGLVIYCTEGQDELATYLAMHQDVRAILVADECDALLREKLKRAVIGFHRRIRVIAINAEEHSHSGGREYFLKHLAANEVEEVLKINFSEVPSESRRRYADLCGGFIGLAADMCGFHPQIAAKGDLSPVMQTIEDYYKLRLPEDQRRHIEAMALVTRVGFKQDFARELEALCAACGLESLDVKGTANKAHDSPGFVGVGGPYFYVRPKIIARVAFGEAWHRWGKSDPHGFLSSFPPSLLDQLQDRVKISAVEEVKDLVSSFFRSWAGKLTPEDLADAPTTERFCTLVETKPIEFLPLLRRLVEDATKNQLLEIKGQWQGGWGPRRSIVWLCERLAAFAEYFGDVEAILLRLALAESETEIGNNATHIWIQMFQLFLSGTSIPFMQRLTRLKEHIYSEDESVSSLALVAIEHTLNLQASRMGGPLVVAGRIPPDEWKPTGQEAWKCVSETLKVLGVLAHSTHPRLSRKAAEIAINNVYSLLGRGFLKDLQAILDPQIISDELKAKAVGALEQALHLQSDFAPTDQKFASTYLNDVIRWKQSLEPVDLRGKMLTALSTDQWRFSEGRRTQWLGEIRELAEELIADPDFLISQFDFLFSESAKTAPILGEEIARLDSAGSLLTRIIEAALKHHNSGFARGYIYGLISMGHADEGKLNELLDQVQERDAQLAYELFLVGGNLTRAHKRTLDLVRRGRLSVRYFRNLAYSAGDNKLAVEEFDAILELLLQRMDGDDVDATETAIEIIAFNFVEGRAETSAFLDRKEMRELCWKVVKKAALNAGRESYSWAKILESLTSYNVERTAKIAAQALVGRGLNQEEDAGKLLVTIAQKEPTIAMRALGAAMLDEKQGWRFFVGRFDIIKQLPTKAVIDWVDSHGVESARRIARQLPSPYLDQDGTPVVPPLTEHILRKFGNDKRVFTEFVAGVHNLQSYMGDIASQHEKEADIARKFLDHPLRKIREWAQIEINDSESQAKYWREWEETQNI